MDSRPGMRDAVRRVQQQLVEAQAALAGETVQAEAGDGAVRVLMSGTQECRALTIAPELLAPAQAARLQALLVEAFNRALHESRLLAARRLGPLTASAGGEGAEA